MVTLRIGDAEREISSPSDIEEGWINRQIQVRRANGETVCAAVAIERPPVSLVLPVGDCPPGGRRRAQLHPTEQRVVALWREQGLDQADFASGRIIVFLRDLFRVLL
jgi:hypothetical protein